MKRRTKFLICEMLFVSAAMICGVGVTGVCFMVASNLLGWVEGRGKS